MSSENNDGLSFQSGHAYPLVDPAHFDDDFGQGYAYALVASDDPVSSQCWMVDCWIVNADGEKHPGYDQNPVPVRKQDVDLSQGLAIGNPYGCGISAVESMRTRGGW